jgi:polar amino acid transport system substrate-binding protein
VAEEAPAGGRMQRILERQRVVVGVKADYPPWGMVAPDGRIVGLEADLARDISDRLGVGLELVPVTSANRLQRLEQGVVDLVIATLGDTEERRRTSDLVRPHYYASGVNLLARAGGPFHDWGQLRGRPVCLTDGAYFNRTLIERHLIDPVVFTGTRDTLLALRDGRCVGWAFDDTVLARLLAEPEWADHRLAMPSILGTPWSVAVRRGEGDAALGRFVADAVADWHRTGRLVALQRAWGLPDSGYLAAQHALWTATADGAPLCARGADGRFPAACLDGGLAGTDGERGALPAWATALQGAAGLDLAPLFDRLDRSRLLDGMRLTLGISLVAIAGALAIGVLLAWADHALPRGPAGRLARLPLRALTTVARMTPPILQLYVVFFGLGGLLASGYDIRPGSFLVAALVFSLYAGASNTVLLGAALGRLRREIPAGPVHRLLPAALDRSYEGLVATSVNIVKAAGLASTIALAETVSAVNTIVAEGGDAATMMNLLLVFYLLFVLAVLGALRAGRGLVTRCARSR